MFTLVHSETTFITPVNKSRHVDGSCVLQNHICEGLVFHYNKLGHTEESNKHTHTHRVMSNWIFHASCNRHLLRNKTE